MKFLNFISLYSKLFTHKKISYSYGGIDSIIQYIFKNKQNGFYVDVGCGHPIKNNNTFLLNKKGWSGINIDLDEANIELFNILRPNDENYCSAISDKIKEVDLFFYHKRSSLNTIDKKTAEYQKAKISSIKKIMTKSLNEIMDNSKYNNREIDFLTVDVEGSELSVLKNFNFKKYKPKIIVVEYLDLSLSQLELKNLDIKKTLDSDIYKLISSNNYTLANMLHSDLVFVNNEFRD